MGFLGKITKPFRKIGRALSRAVGLRKSNAAIEAQNRQIEEQQKRLDQEREQMENRNRQRNANEEGLVEQRDRSDVGNPHVLTDPEIGDGLIVGYRKLNKKQNLGG